MVVEVYTGETRTHTSGDNDDRGRNSGPCQRIVEAGSEPECVEDSTASKDDGKGKWGNRGFENNTLTLWRKREFIPNAGGTSKQVGRKQKLSTTVVDRV